MFTSFLPPTYPSRPERVRRFFRTVRNVCFAGITQPPRWLAVFEFYASAYLVWRVCGSSVGVGIGIVVFVWWVASGGGAAGKTKRRAR